MNQSKRAQFIATLAHDGQDDKGGVPYIAHPQRVVDRLIECEVSITDEMLAVAWLHDVVENTEWTLEDLYRLGKFTEGVIDGVDAITQRWINPNMESDYWVHWVGDPDKAEGWTREPLEVYWARIKANPIARIVKVYGDIPDNNDPERQKVFTPEKREKMRAKYARALEFLND